MVSNAATLGAVFIMKVIIGSTDRFLTENLRRLAQAEKLFPISTNKLDRMFAEMKVINRVAIIDMAWEDIQERGILRQIVNIARISGNKVICVCPNQEEALKKMARLARPDEIFLRYDLETTFKDFLKLCYLETNVRAQG